MHSPDVPPASGRDLRRSRRRRNRSRSTTRLRRSRHAGDRRCRRRRVPPGRGRRPIDDAPDRGRLRLLSGPPTNDPHPTRPGPATRLVESERRVPPGHGRCGRAASQLPAAVRLGLGHRQHGRDPGRRVARQREQDPEPLRGPVVLGSRICQLRRANWLAGEGDVGPGGQRVGPRRQQGLPDLGDAPWPGALDQRARPPQRRHPRLPG